MYISIVFIFFLTGLIFGSFGNVIIYRLPKKISILYPPSNCPYCGKNIKWYDNIPLLSYFFLNGKCRFCKSKIPITYPLVEFLSGLLAVLLYLKYGIPAVVVLFNLLFVLLVVSVIDIQTTEIPNELSYYLIISGVLLSGINTVIGGELFTRIANSLLGGIFGLVFLYLISLVGYKIFNKPAVGGGDVKLMCGVGCYLGMSAVIKILFLSSLFASLYVLVMSMLKRQKLWGKYVQYAPFIALACAVYIFCFRL